MNPKAQNLRELAQRLLEARELFLADPHIIQKFGNIEQEVRLAFYQNPRPPIGGNVIDVVQTDKKSIEHLCTALLEALDTLEFYADKKNWSNSFYEMPNLQTPVGDISSKDLSPPNVDLVCFGGKKAREILRKYGVG